uniref:CCHC-type domain-containing protein n=1 Tax=Tanacetum cinerariifolium TaxID=118510 RepID=A0A6L2P2N8_TANCI|nr:hypothetical protein [Tanacetum cinerariifolium]
MMKETPYELLADDKKKNLRKNNEAKMALYNVLPRKEFSCVKSPRRGNRFRRGLGNGFGNKGVESSRQKHDCYNCKEEGHFIGECPKSKENKMFIRGAWSDSENDNEPQKDATCHGDQLSREFKKSRVVLDNMLSRQKLSQDKEGLGFSKNTKTTSKEYDGGHVVFRRNLKVKVNSGVKFTKMECTISKNGKTLAKGHRRNGLYTCKLGDNSKQQICLGSMVDKSMLCHRRLGYVNMSEFDEFQFGSFCEQHEMSYNLPGPFTSQSSEIVERTHHKLRKMSRAMSDEQSIP